MRRTAEAAARTRQNILDAALWVFAEKGWAGTTLDDIARRCGVTRGAVYHHARDKADLLITLLKENWATAMTSAWKRLSTPDEEAVTRLTGFLAEFLRLLEEDKRFRALAVVTAEVAPHLPVAASGATEEKQDTLASWRDALHSVVTEVDEATLRSGLSPEEIVDALMAVVYGATSLSSETGASRCGAPGPAVAASIVYGLIEGAETKR